MRAYYRTIFAGLLMGVGCVLPGVSGGVIAVSFGLYAPMLEAVLGFPRTPKQSLRFLWPIALGGGLGFLLGAKFINAVMSRYEAPTLFLFTGFILGGIPDLMNEADKGTVFRPRCLMALGLGLVLGLLTTFLPGRAREPLAELSVTQALMAGALEGIGTVVPGISTSFLLIYLGWYQAYLAAVSTVDIRTLALFAAGFAALALLSMKAVQWLLRRAKQFTYYAILGFLIASVGLVFPGFGGSGALWLNLLMLTLGLLCALWLGRTNRSGTPSL